jgi:hypothetical protein
MNNAIKAEHVRAVLKATKGRFTKIEYTNQKGEKKIYTVRTGVTKYLAQEPEPNWTPRGGNPFVKVYSVTRGNVGYKTFYPERISFLSCGQLRVS